MVRVGGNGKGARINRASSDRVTTAECAVDTNEVFQLLQLCYRNDFFDLREAYGPRNWPRLREDGTVELMGTVVSGGAGRTVAIEIGKYSKSVAYTILDPPPVVLELASRIEKLCKPVEAK